MLEYAWKNKTLSHSIIHIYIGVHTTHTCTRKHIATGQTLARIVFYKDAFNLINNMKWSTSITKETHKHHHKTHMITIGWQWLDRLKYPVVNISKSKRCRWISKQTKKHNPNDHQTNEEIVIAAMFSFTKTKIFVYK